jgi:hypothetical protein
MLTTAIRFACILLAASGLISSAEAAEEYYGPYLVGPKSTQVQSGVPVVDVAYYWTSNMPALYYSTYETWPVSWQAIVDSGIFTAPLLSTRGRNINPDDGKLDFAGDIQYMFKGAQEPPMLAQLLKNGRVKYLRFSDRTKPLTYSERWKKGPAGYPEAMWKATGLTELGANRARYQQMAVQSAFHSAASLHLLIHGGYCDWNALQASGLSPHAPGTINPLTRKPWKGDGSPNDLLYIYSKDGVIDGRASFRTKDGGIYVCQITDEKGNTPWDFR